MSEQATNTRSNRGRDNRRNREQATENEYTEKIIAVNRVCKTVKGGRHMGFSVLVCVGDRKGKVGIAIGKAKAVPDAVRKGIEKARKEMVDVNLYKNTVTHPYIGKFGSSQVVIRPAAPGTGVIAGGAVRAIFEALGVQDVLSKRIGSKNPVNMAKATMNALRDMRGVECIAKSRGITPGQVVNG